jgi:hypothetical protein
MAKATLLDFGNCDHCPSWRNTSPDDVAAGAAIGRLPDYGVLD